MTYCYGLASVVMRSALSSTYNDSNLAHDSERKKSICYDDQGRVSQSYKVHDPLGRGSCVMVCSHNSFTENAFVLLLLMFKLGFGSYK